MFKLFFKSRKFLIVNFLKSNVSRIFTYIRFPTQIIVENGWYTFKSKYFRIANKNEIILYVNKYISKNLINKFFLTVYLHKDILKVNARHKTY